MRLISFLFFKVVGVFVFHWSLYCFLNFLFFRSQPFGVIVLAGRFSIHFFLFCLVSARLWSVFLSIIIVNSVGCSIFILFIAKFCLVGYHVVFFMIGCASVRFSLFDCFYRKIYFILKSFIICAH